MLEGQCVICGQQALGHPRPAGAAEDRSWSEHLPPLEMCEAHWGQYDRDWLLLGWCVNHYGEALAQCPVHEQVIEPL